MKGDPYDVAIAMCDRGMDAVDAGDLTTAEQLFREAASQGWVGGLVCLGYVHDLRGDEAAAASAYRSALASPGKSENELRVKDHGAARLAPLAFAEAKRHAKAAAEASQDFSVSEAMFRDAFRLVEQATGSDTDWNIAEGALAGAQAATIVGIDGQIGRPHYGVTLELLLLALDHGDEEQRQRAGEILQAALVRFEAKPLSRSVALSYEPGGQAWLELQRRGLVPEDLPSRTEHSPGTGTATGFCSHCGSPRSHQTARFCSSCGTEYL